MNLYRMLRMLAIVVTMATTSLAHAATTSFASTGTKPQQLNGLSLGGWTFGGNWVMSGHGSQNMPIMNDVDGAQFISYDAGLFTFESMSLNSRPWEDFPLGPYLWAGNFVLGVSFLDGRGDTILSDSIILANSDAFFTYARNVAGVHAILFKTATAGKERFWPRLAGITTGQDVPEPTTVLLLAVGLIALVLSIAQPANRRA